MIQGLFETHIRVSNLEQSIEFYRDVLGLELARQQPERKVAFFWVGQPNQYMLGLWEHPQDEIFRQHFAFRVTVDDIHNAESWLKERGIEPRNFLNDGTQKPMVFGWMPAIAIYFPDPDGHSLEFIAPLTDAPQPDLGVVTWEEWTQRTTVTG